MYKPCFHVIGLTDGRTPHFPPEVQELIRHGHIFSGGLRHHEIVAPLLPEDARWIDITVPLDHVLRQYEAFREIIVFASGDPLFFGFANTLKREIPHAEIRVYPAFNSLQLLSHRMLLAYHDLHTLSLTGRPWDALDEALIRGTRLIGILTDKVKTPASIASRMLEYGYVNYRMTVGECLGNDTEEQVTSYNLTEAAALTFRSPNCLILERTDERPRPFGIPESQFALLDGRTKMITKMPIRLLTLSRLELHNRRCLWDIGSCTGSVSIEAKLQFPHLQVVAFEKRPEGETLLRKNSRRFGTPGIRFVGGDILTADFTGLPHPDAVFIGGHGGRLREIIRKLQTVMLPGCTIVFNAVSEESCILFREAILQEGLHLMESTRITIDTHNPIEILKAE